MKKKIYIHIMKYILKCVSLHIIQPDGKPENQNPQPNITVGKVMKYACQSNWHQSCRNFGRRPPADNYHIISKSSKFCPNGTITLPRSLTLWECGQTWGSHLAGWPPQAGLLLLLLLVVRGWYWVAVGVFSVSGSHSLRAPPASRLPAGRLGFLQLL